MAITLDIIVVAVIVLCVIFGYKNGFVKTVYRLLRTVGSFIVALIFAKPVSYILAETPLFKSIIDGIGDKIQSIELFSHEAKNGISIEESLTPAAKQMLDNLNISLAEFGEQISALISTGEQNLKDGVRDYVLTPIAESLSFAIAFILLFLGTAIALKILSVVLEGTLRLVGLEKVNRTFGLVIGLAQGFIYALVICTLVSAFMPYLSASELGITPAVVADTYVFKEIAKIGTSWFVTPKMP